MSVCMQFALSLSLFLRLAFLHSFFNWFTLFYLFGLWWFLVILFVLFRLFDTRLLLGALSWELLLFRFSLFLLFNFLFDFLYNFLFDFILNDGLRFGGRCLLRVLSGDHFLYFFLNLS